ncbi:MAG TPA: hypothetical protein VLY46_02025 [Usitatibacter sp.]|nr:hypothetical protein [Usitatibacter sp.]
MTNVSSCDRDAREPLVRAVVPVLVAVGAVTLALAMVRGQPFAQEPAAAAAAEVPPSAPPADQPAAYSEMHRQVQEAPGAPQPLPPTF